MGNWSSFERASSAGLRSARGKTWTVELKLHVALAAVAILGWSVAYTVLTHSADTTNTRVARSDSPSTKITASLSP